MVNALRPLWQISAPNLSFGHEFSPASISLYRKLSVVACLLINIVWGCSSSAYFSCWMSIELGLIIFIPLCILGGRRYGTLLAVKYLLIQRVAGLLILGGLVLSVFDRLAGFMGPGLSLMLLLKLGGFPFFHWLILIGEKLGWLPLYLILTLQKLIPLFILSHTPSNHCLRKHSLWSWKM